MCKFRDLRADEIDVRVGQATEKGVSLLLYKDARVDMNILDETVGALNWQREHYEVKGNLYCRVGINKYFDNPDYPPVWVWKSDCGTESQAEAEKGESSDSFKRACTNLGIGRELYTAPFIWVGADKCKIVPKGQKFACYDDFSVQSIEIKDKHIVALEIINTKTKALVYSFGKVKTPTRETKPVTSENTAPAVAPAETKPIDAKELEQLREWAKGYIVEFGEHRGHTLIWLYKNNRAAFEQLKTVAKAGEGPCGDAIKIIEEWVAEFKAA